MSQAAPARYAPLEASAPDSHRPSPPPRTLCSDVVSCRFCTQSACFPDLKERGGQGLTPTSSLVLCTQFDDTWTGRWALNDGQAAELLQGIQADKDVQIKGGRLEVQDLVRFFGKETNRTWVKTMPSCAHGLLSEAIVRKAFSVFDLDRSGTMYSRDWSAFLERVKNLYLEILLRQAFQNFNAFFGRGQLWNPVSHQNASLSLVNLRKDLLEAAGTSCVRTSGDAMLGANAYATSLAEIGIARKERVTFQVGCDDDCMTSGYSPFSPGLLEDLYYYSANNHPLHGIIACDEGHPLSHAARFGMEVAAIGLSLFTLTLRHAWVTEGEAPVPWLANEVHFGLVMVVLPGMALWWIMFLLLTCGWCDSGDVSQERGCCGGCCSFLGKMLGYLIMLASVLSIVLSARLEGPDFRRALQLALIARLISYAASWLFMVAVPFNTILAWGQPNPSGGCCLGDYIGLGQWRIEKQRFQARCLEALEATYVNYRPPEVAREMAAPEPARVAEAMGSSADMAAGHVASAAVAVGGAVGGAAMSARAFMAAFASGINCTRTSSQADIVRATSCCANESRMLQANWKYASREQVEYEKLESYGVAGDVQDEKKEVPTSNCPKVRRCCVWFAAAVTLLLVLGVLAVGQSPDDLIAKLQAALPEPLEAMLPEPNLQRVAPALRSSGNVTTHGTVSDSKRRQNGTNATSSGVNATSARTASGKRTAAEGVKDGIVIPSGAASLGWNAKNNSNHTARRGWNGTNDTHRSGPVAARTSGGEAAARAKHEADRKAEAKERAKSESAEQAEQEPKQQEKPKAEESPKTKEPEEQAKEGATKSARAQDHDCDFQDVEEWNSYKKAWCCFSVQKGCEPVAASTRASSSSSAKAETEEKPASHSWNWPRGRFDCRVGLFRWNDTWTKEKKAFCCESPKDGCTPRRVRSTPSSRQDKKTEEPSSDFALRLAGMSEEGGAHGKLEE